MSVSTLTHGQYVLSDRRHPHARSRRLRLQSITHRILTGQAARYREHLLLSGLIDHHRKTRNRILLGLHLSQVEADRAYIALRTVVPRTSRIFRRFQQRGIHRRLCGQHCIKGRRATDVLEAEGHIEHIPRQQLVFRIEAQLQVQYRSPSHTQGLRVTVSDDIIRGCRCAHLRFENDSTLGLRRLQSYRQNFQLIRFEVVYRPGHCVTATVVAWGITHSRTDIGRAANIQRHRRRACRPVARVAQVNKRRELRAHIDHTLRLGR